MTDDCGPLFKINIDSVVAPLLNTASELFTTTAAKITYSFSFENDETFCLSIRTVLKDRVTTDDRLMYIMSSNHTVLHLIDIPV